MDDKWEIDTGNELLSVLEASNGGTIEITRDGEVIATVTPKPKRQEMSRQEAMEHLLSLNLDLGLKPGETIKDLINEGRKY